MNYRRIKQRNARLLLDDIHSKRSVFRGLPDVINFHSSDVCDLRCIMCYQSHRPGRVSLPPSRVREILDQALPTARKVRLFSAGEPLLDGFEETIARVRHYQCRLEVMTNGLHLDLKRFQMMEESLERLVVSLESHREEVLDRIRGRGVHRNLMRNLTEVGDYVKTKSKNFVSEFRVVLMKENAPHLGDFLRFAHESRVDWVRIVPWVPTSLEPRSTSLGLTPRETAEVLASAQQSARDLAINLLLDGVGEDNVFGFAVRQLEPAPLPTYACGQLTQEITIHPDESVYPCTEPTDLRLGSLQSQSLTELWNGRTMRRLRRQMFSQDLKGACSSCSSYSVDPRRTLSPSIPGSEVALSLDSPYQK